MKNIVIGRFVPGNSFLYTMDPRTKILTLIILMVATFLITSFIHMLIALGMIMIILLVGKISIMRVYLGLRPLMFLLIFTFSFQIFFNKQGAIIVEETLNYSIYNIILVAFVAIVWLYTKKYIKYRFLYLILIITIIFSIFIYLELGTVYKTGSLTIHEQGLKMAFFIMMRLIIIVTLSTILTLSTKPTDLNLGLEAVFKPFKIIGVNTEELAMIISISLRYIPTLLDEANKIMLAQASRGVDFSEGKLKDKVLQIVSLLVPMFIISFKRSDELANAMEARSFVPGSMRTRLHILAWKKQDTLTLTIAFSLLVLAIVLRIVS